MCIIKSKKDRFAFILIFIAGIFATVFYYINHIDIVECSVSSDTFTKKSITLPYSEKSQSRQNYIYECKIKSNTTQNALLGIAVDDSFDTLHVNNKEVSLEHLHAMYAQKTLKDYSRGYKLSVQLKEGINQIRISGHDAGGKFGLKLAMSYSYGEYLFLFVFCVLPLLIGVYQLLFDRIFERNYRDALSLVSWKNLPYLIIILGIILRLFLLTSVNNTMYQHDFKGHVDTIKHYCEYPLEIPQNDKSLQFPQQPLYYMSSAVVYSISKALGFNEYDAIYSVRALSVFYAALWLLLSLALARLYLKSAFVINIFMAFMAFTPSFIFLGAVVNNDSLNALFGVWALYEIASYMIKKKKRHFYRASLAILLASLTKISSLLFAIYFVVVLLMMYYQNDKYKERLKQQILLFGMSILFIFGFALIKSHIPTTGEFLFVNSALYSNQIIPEFSLEYFFSFHWLSLIDEAQSYVMGSDTIRHSLPTYFYGTMFTGEFNIARYFQAGEFFKLSSQLMLFLGAIYIVGLVSFFYFYRYLSSLQKHLVIPIVINLLLIIKFLSDYWVVCNSDFRYFTPTIAAIGLVFVIGINALTNKFEWFKKPIVALVSLLALSEMYWIVQLIEKT